MNQKSYPPKDGGWGWFVVFGAAVYAFLTRGFSRSFSLIFEEIRHKFGTSASSTAWIYSAMVTTSLCSGPMSTMLSTRFSVRKTGLFGSCLLCVGFLTSVFAPNLICIYLAFTLIGFGSGLISSPSLIIIREWFDKRRARATSFALMPDGLGMIALGPLLQYLLSNYGYSGTMLIVSAIMANHIAGCALFRLPDKLDYVDVCKLGLKECSNIDKEHLSRHSIELKALEECNISKTEKLSDSNAPDGSVETRNSKEGNLVTTQTTLDKNNIENLSESGSECSKKQKIDLKDENSKATTLPMIETFEKGTIKEMTSDQSLHQEDAIHSEEVDNVQKSYSEKIIKYFDYRLFAMGHYLTFCFLMMSASLCFSMGNTHIAGLAKEVGLDSNQLAVLFTVSGSVSIGSRFLSGFLFDIPAVRKVRVHVFAGFAIIVGGSLLVCPFIHNAIGFYVTWGLYASTVAVFFTQESIVLADLVGKEKFPSALGISRFFRGLGVLIGPTFGGFLKDYTQVYDYTFIFGGVCFLSTVTLFEVSLFIVNRKKNRVQAL